MKNLTILSVACLLLLWGIYLYIKSPTDTNHSAQALEEREEIIKENLSKKGSITSAKRVRELDQIGNVINESNAKIDSKIKGEIVSAKKKFDDKEQIAQLEVMLEQSYHDTNSTIKDIKRIQDQLAELKTKNNKKIVNTERWDPRFVYYLMIQENYTYAEVNLIKSLQENGISLEEVEYINELIKEPAFMERVISFKEQGEADYSRSVAAVSPKKKLHDDFIDDVEEGKNLEEKLIEMNYTEDEKEEMIYGHNQ